VIDDSSFQRKWISKHIADLGHVTVEAADGKQGIDMVSSEHPDCITVDLNMPVMDGIAFLKDMKEKNVATPIIVVTADIQAATKKQCSLLGATAFVNKPCEKADLNDAIQQCFKGEPGGEG